ncbi:MAG: hypothetical protein ACI8SE_001549 [Bacteroidia bacterium]|jgi:hypothetical protein
MQQKQPFWGKTILLIALTLIATSGLRAQQSKTDSLSKSNKRKTFVLAGNGVAYSATMFGLYNLWYKDYPLTTFHFHNDNKHWNQMDKVGHAYSCYYEGVVGIDMLKWAGFSHKTASIVGGSYGFFIQTGIEVLDGFSEEWGASTGDIIANAIGTGMVVSQSLLWDEQRVWMKVSYQPTTYANIRPELLGANALARLFKDYNGQTYWLSGNINSFLRDDHPFPNWLNIAVGYGIDGFVSADDNRFERKNVVFDYTHIPQGRQFYLTPDIDLTRIKTNNKALKISLRLLNCIKFPLPGLTYNTKSQKLDFNFIQF